MAAAMSSPINSTPSVFWPCHSLKSVGKIELLLTSDVERGHVKGSLRVPFFLVVNYI